jgi:Peptidase family S41
MQKLQSSRLILAAFFLLFLLSFKADRAKGFPCFFTKEKAIADLRFYKGKLIQYHPNLYLYTPQAEFLSFCDSLEKSITKSPSLVEFYNLITLLHSKIKDGHTHIYPSTELINSNNAKEKFFPFKIYWHDQGMYVVETWNRFDQKMNGCRLISVNGRGANSIMHEMLEHNIHDGDNTTYPVWILNNYFSNYFSFHYGNPENFQLVYETQDGLLDSALYPAMSKDSIAYYKLKNGPAASKVADAFSLSFPNEKTACMAIPSFDNSVLKNEYHTEFKKRVNDFFEAILAKKSENLIIDLRNNQGGDVENGKLLLSWIQNEPFTIIDQYSVVGNPVDETNRLKKSDGPCQGIFQPKKKHFTGKVILLINGGSFSNSAIVCSSLRRNKRALFIGEETGGNPVVLAGDGKDFVLPYSQISITIPDKQYRMEPIQNNTGRGLMPDLLLVLSQDDILLHRDPVMDKAKELAQ